jgi:phosphoglycerate kinase
MSILWLDDCDLEALANKNVLCRVDFNVPMSEAGSITDAMRIEMTLPTIRRLVKAQAKVVLASHLGRPKGKIRPALSLEPIANYVRDLLNQEVTFVHDCVGDGIARIINNQPAASITILENLRFHSGEEKNDPVFAKLLARGMDFYVDDAFGAAHRAHASVDGVVKFFDKPMGGLLLRKEINHFEEILNQPRRPLVAIIGGSKVSSKIGALVQLIKKVDALLIGGAMAYTFLKAQSYNIGASLVEDEQIHLALGLLRKADELGVKIYLPVDHVVAKEPGKTNIRVINSEDFEPNDVGFDIGPETVKSYKELLEQAKIIFWNGPLGMYEDERFSAGTTQILKIVAQSLAYKIIAGGDTIAALNKAGLSSKIDFISTGGGASLELLEGKRLPGLQALGYYS